MSREEAIEMLKKDKEQRGNCFISDALDMAIKALEQEPVIEPLERLAESASKTAKALERLSEQEPTLDKIRAEINKLWHKRPNNRYEEGLKDQALKVMQIIDKYRKEN